MAQGAEWGQVSEEYRPDPRAMQQIDEIMDSVLSLDKDQFSAYYHPHHPELSDGEVDDLWEWLQRFKAKRSARSKARQGGK